MLLFISVFMQCMKHWKFLRIQCNWTKALQNLDKSCVDHCIEANCGILTIEKDDMTNI